jgi:hypothetical protein
LSMSSRSIDRKGRHISCLSRATEGFYVTAVNEDE